MKDIFIVIRYYQSGYVARYYFSTEELARKRIAVLKTYYNCAGGEDRGYGGLEEHWRAADSVQWISHSGEKVIEMITEQVDVA